LSAPDALDRMKAKARRDIEDARRNPDPIAALIRLQVVAEDTEAKAQRMQQAVPSEGPAADALAELMPFHAWCRNAIQEALKLAAGGAR
jgi:alkanesulfonate monooxygenase SsuD/methylene tetrahydromethanopterin reductase-like flavin-dependent oxidoreductase (luciferase family)